MEPVKPLAWSDIPEESMPALAGTVLRRYRSGEQLTIARVRFAANSRTEVHTHPNEQFSFVLSGELLFTVDGREVLVKSGELLHLPSNVPHGAASVGEAEVLDVFAPPRADWEADRETPAGTETA